MSENAAVSAAKAHLAAGRPDEALAVLRSLPDDIRMRPDIAGLESRVALLAGDLVLAETRANEAIRQDPKSLDARSVLARLATGQGDPISAFNHWKAARTRKRGLKAAAWLLAQRKVQRIQIDRAPSYDLAVINDPEVFTRADSSPAFAIFEQLAASRDSAGLHLLEMSLRRQGRRPWAAPLAAHVRATAYFNLQCYSETIQASDIARRLLADQTGLAVEEKTRRRFMLDVLHRRARTVMGAKVEFFFQSAAEPVTRDVWNADLNNGWRRAPKRSLTAATHLTFAEKPPVAAQVLFVLLPLFQGDGERALRNLDILMLRHKDLRRPLHPDVAFAAAALFGTLSDTAQRAAFLNLGFARMGLEAPLSGEGAGTFSDLGTAALPAASRGPLVTVSMNAFNAGATITEALRSIRGQTYANLQIIVIDDASTDDTHAKAAAQAAQDSRITLLRNTRNSGAYVARNDALARATGEFFTCHDADDWGPSAADRTPCRIHGRRARRGGVELKLDSHG